MACLCLLSLPLASCAAHGDPTLSTRGKHPVLQKSVSVLTLQNTSKPPAALLPTHGNFHLTLLLSSLDAYTPLSYPLGDVSLPPSILKPLSRKRHDLPARPGEPAFQPEIELFHTFRAEEDLGGMGMSLVGTILALSPWAVLVALVSAELLRGSSSSHTPSCWSWRSGPADSPSATK
jgi:hypothetical protein